jgi:tetratricopeptide (TPR) repeat protein
MRSADCGIGLAPASLAPRSALCIPHSRPLKRPWGVRNLRLPRFIGLALGVLAAIAAVAASAAPGQNDLVQRPWFEARTACFHIYSCGPTQEVARLAMRLEQFREAYAVLAGSQAVASPPIVVFAFPDHAAMAPFLPLYDGKPANLSAFFSRGSHQNLIVLALSGSDEASLKVIFHEYAHLLLRRNQLWWPLWLSEGMAEIYATFEINGARARIGLPLDHHLRLLAHTPLMPLHDLFSVSRDSPSYNERQHQGLFYSESWLLTHYLMLGGNPAHKNNFRQLTPLLREGQSPEQAFTNAFHTSLPAMQAELRRYLQRGTFTSLELTLPASLATPRTLATRRLTPMEVCYHLGEELSHIGRLEAAETWFRRAMKLAPASPLPYEGLGLLAARRGQLEESIRDLRKATQLGPLNFLGHYIYGREQYLRTGHDQRLGPLPEEAAVPIRAELQKSLALMPDFGPAQHLLGFFELVQGKDLAAAEKHIQRAIQLEPENPSYMLSLAQLQVARQDAAAARRTLLPLRLPYVDPEVRAHAEEMLKTLDTPSAPSH